MVGDFKGVRVEGIVKMDDVFLEYVCCWGIWVVEYFLVRRLFFWGRFFRGMIGMI